MNVAVLSLTRDRLGYTKHCFHQLRRFAGCDFDHYVLDQGSTDGTQEWLRDNVQWFKWLELLPENIGISKALNRLLPMVDGADVVVKFDNDCELVTPKTLLVACRLAMHGNVIVSPHIQGLNSPPAVEQEVEVCGERLGLVGQLGGIFMAIPGGVFTEFRFDEDNPKWGMDDVQLSQYFRNRGGSLAYLLSYPANHYQTTEGQKQTYPDYWDRKKVEMGLV